MNSILPAIPRGKGYATYLLQQENTGTREAMVPPMTSSSAFTSALSGGFNIFSQQALSLHLTK